MALHSIDHSIFMTTKQISSSLAQIFSTDYTRQIIAKQEESTSSFSGERA